MKNKDILIIGCGAIAHEVSEIIELNNWDNVRLQCLNAELHNTPKILPRKIKEAIDSNINDYSKIFLAYADCGTGGLIDLLLKDYDIERLDGAHCYEFYSGSSVFKELSEKEIGTFYLTDFLVKNFDRLVIEGLGIQKYPSLKEDYFRNYKNVVYLAQLQDNVLESKARECADYLNLEFSVHFTGLKNLGNQLNEVMK
ncbi:MAG: hypothetical protein CMQ73_06570 [Gammaproteobacteria bacterium]|nr:hypothetical protein [Gammaproteobacteria bacterium]OUT93183.1 MAG: hypothetical protein CBB96_08590 [Gammaproteobacteria bacterium TMED36]|tara:strand:- start:2184 stop:2777 length:594 start_codon:yes stop_codon:yes gene_type:complete